jgi:hypothetical protein
MSLLKNRKKEFPQIITSSKPQPRKNTKIEVPPGARYEKPPTQKKYQNRGSFRSPVCGNPYLEKVRKTEVPSET